MNQQQQWEAVLERDAAYTDAFVYAVSTTGIFCRPTCPSRRPKRENVAFFDTPAQAAAAGYRPCRRCTPQAAHEPPIDLVIGVCRYLEQPHEGIPTLADLGERFATGPTHLQRTFTRIVGISPHQYADAHRQHRLRDAIRQHDTVLDAIYAAGYTTPSQIYEQDVLGMPPVQYRQGGEAVDIRYTVAACPLGQMLVAATERGVCCISLGDAPGPLIDALVEEFPAAAIRPDDTGLGLWVRALIGYLEGEHESLALPLDIRATGFQRRVWAALRQIPYGQTRSYSAIAEAIGQPKAARAVAGACAANPVALAIPCHRVVRSSGTLSGYRWGVGRKRHLLEMEQR